jgi:mannosyl-3-phosphoglycerate phosphatase
MAKHFKQPACPLLVYTDLDGTLLDHDSYSFRPAVAALERLAKLAVPVIPVTSKTLAELEVLRGPLGLTGPCIAENGGLIAIPRGYFEPDPPLEGREHFLVDFLSPRYGEILATLAGLRREFGFNFIGFSDMSDAEVARLTGLDIEQARRARQRLCSEPLLWRDSMQALSRFSQALESRNCTLMEGGRFHHVLGPTDKARAIDRLSRYFSQAGFANFTSIALGDSPNDTLMLQATDVAVVIRRKDGSWLPLETRGEKVQTRATGPEGWNEFFQQYLDTMNMDASTQRITHG